MLLNTIKHLWQKLFAAKKTSPTINRGINFLEEGECLLNQGNIRLALNAFKKHLETDPYNVIAINCMGVCLSDLGDLQAATNAFGLAYSLDDTHLPAIVNYAKLLIDQNKINEARSYLRQARIIDPNFSHTDAVYAGLCLKTGNVTKAREIQLKAWLANFDNLRLANCHLFNCTYDDIDEEVMAAEHQFWAKTLRPLNTTEISAFSKNTSSSSKRKIRIGYISPDFRNHSVRYFFRPLLENHNKEKFETFLYHDHFISDAQTASIQEKSDHFFNVYEKSDLDLISFIRSHELDILVELAGHTSNNRISLFQAHMADLQISALGYPPTTGLETIDAKLLDKYLITENSAKFYTEKPLILPSSFWCFDPDTPAELALEPPLTRNGYITFGCVGNIAKISLKILGCWRIILQRTPRSRLLIRSISFEDPAAIDSCKHKFTCAGIPMNRVDFKLPQGGKNFLESYNDIDIILDTYPFNGGTTSCFAVYMGVPIVSWTGKSLISRMGFSILSNLEATKLIAEDEESYINCAVNASKDKKFLKQFKKESRKKMQQTGLGNGEIFAQEFEDACLQLLLTKIKKTSEKYKTDISTLPANEITRRAYQALRHNQHEAANRIIAYCLEKYPACAGAHILATAQISDSNQNLKSVSAYLQSKLHLFTDAEKAIVLVNIARCLLLLEDKLAAQQTIDQIQSFMPADIFDARQLQLYQAMRQSAPEVVIGTATDFSGKLHCIIPCNQIERYNSISSKLHHINSSGSNYNITITQCSEENKIDHYRALKKIDGSDVILILQKNIDIVNPNFFDMILCGLSNCDVLGFSGATRYVQTNWKNDLFEFKIGSSIVTSNENPDFFELQFLGPSKETMESGAALLHGGLIACKANLFQQIDFDENLSSADCLMEEFWTHKIFLQGNTLGVHQNLGVNLRSDNPLDSKHIAASKMRIADQLSFNPLDFNFNEDSILTIPVKSINEALKISAKFLEPFKKQPPKKR